MNKAVSLLGAFLMFLSFAFSKPLKIVIDFHSDKESKFKLLLNNLKNLSQYANNDPKKLQIVIVFYSQGIKYALHDLSITPFKNDKELVDHEAEWHMILDMYKQSGILHYHVCDQSLKAFGVSPKNVASFAKVVPAGIIDIAKLEHEGYAYIKP